MVFNQRLAKFFGGAKKDDEKDDGAEKVGKDGVVAIEMDEIERKRRVSQIDMVHGTSPRAVEYRAKLEAKEQEAGHALNRPTTFRAGLTHFMVKEDGIITSSAIHMIDEMLGDVRETFDAIDTNKNNALSPDELGQLLKQVSGGNLYTPEAVAELLKAIDTDGDGAVSFDEFQAFYLSSKLRYGHEFDKTLKANGIGEQISESELTELFIKLQEEVGLECNLERVKIDLGILPYGTVLFPL
jgi:hypothetical protein